MKLSEYQKSLSGMMAAQLAISITKQNISNLHTEGYVRQKVNFGATGATTSSGLPSGYGVKPLDIERVTDEVKTMQYNQQLSEFSYYEYAVKELSGVEGLFGTSDESSLAALTDRFFQAWHEVEKNPTQPTYYQTVVSEADKLSSELNRITSSLWQLKARAAEGGQFMAAEFNRLAKQLAETNEKIGDAGLQPPNQLLDERDQAIKNLAKLAKVDTTFESENPHVATLRINGLLLVSGADHYPLEVDSNLTLRASGAEVKINGGSIQAAIDLNVRHIPDYIQKISEFSKNLGDQVNAILGTTFFTGEEGNLHVYPPISANPASLKVTAETAKQVTELAKQAMSPGITYKTALDQLVVKVASDVNSAQSYMTIHEDLLMGIEQEKLNVEGVNMDEEMVNLMMYQNYFAANSKAIRTLNEMYESLFALI